jgi:hypothetical protein
VGVREGLQPEDTPGNPHVNLGLVELEFQNIFPVAETLGDLGVTGRSILSRHIR